MLHRALFGSIERFLGILLEHHGAALPAWLAPDQIAVVAGHLAPSWPRSGRLRTAGARRAAGSARRPGRDLVAADRGGASRRRAIRGGDRRSRGGGRDALDPRARGTVDAPVSDAIAELARRCRGDGSPARDAAAAHS